MRKIKQKERVLAGNIYCDHCKPAKVDAIYRACGFASHELGDYACEGHKELIRVDDDSRMTEADYQTWGAL